MRSAISRFSARTVSGRRTAGSASLATVARPLSVFFSSFSPPVVESSVLLFVPSGSILGGHSRRHSYLPVVLRVVWWVLVCWCAPSAVILNVSRVYVRRYCRPAGWLVGRARSVVPIAAYPQCGRLSADYEAHPAARASRVSLYRLRGDWWPTTTATTATVACPVITRDLSRPPPPRLS